jgi:hypothetical protein
MGMTSGVRESCNTLDIDFNMALRQWHALGGNLSFTKLKFLCFSGIMQQRFGSSTYNTHPSLLIKPRETLPGWIRSFLSEKDEVVRRERGHPPPNKAKELRLLSSLFL